eukprot:733596-Amphidinium_carterae.1
MGEKGYSTAGSSLNQPSHERHQSISYWGKSVRCVPNSNTAPCIPRTGQENYALAAYRSALV